MKTKIVLILLGISVGIKAQNSGNANYGNNMYEITQFGTTAITQTYSDEMVIQIRGIYNEMATSQIAVFSILQVGKSAEEATILMDERIRNVRNEIEKYNSEIEIVTDVISFVPMYEFEENKKIFNPKTYNEKPSGFELKKNLIIKYKKTNDLSVIISACAKNEIYDLAKVDYLTTKYDYIKTILQSKALEEFKKQIINYSTIMNVDLNKKEKYIQEGYNIIYPMESYRKYTAFSQANINFDKNSNVKNIKKNETQYYNAALAKTHSFVVNPEITEPSIQFFYDLTIRIKLKEDQLPKNTIQKNNKYFIVTPTGDLKKLNLE